VIELELFRWLEERRGFGVSHFESVAERVFLVKDAVLFDVQVRGLDGKVSAYALIYIRELLILNDYCIHQENAELSLLESDTYHNNIQSRIMILIQPP
jgi:hypothetical protein